MGQFIKLPIFDGTKSGMTANGVHVANRYNPIEPLQVASTYDNVYFGIINQTNITLVFAAEETNKTGSYMIGTLLKSTAISKYNSERQLYYNTTSGSWNSNGTLEPYTSLAEFLDDVKSAAAGGGYRPYPSNSETCKTASRLQYIRANGESSPEKGGGINGKN